MRYKVLVDGLVADTFASLEEAKAFANLHAQKFGFDLDHKVIDSQDEGRVVYDLNHPVEAPQSLDV